MKDKIYIDGSVLVTDHFSGIGHYVIGILRGLDDDETKSRKIRVIIPYDRHDKFKEYGLKNIKAIRYPLPFAIMFRLINRRLLPPYDLLFGKAVYVFPHFVNLPLLFSKSILVIYDLSYVLYPEYGSDRNVQWLQKYVRKSVSRANHVITISDSARQELIDYYLIKPSDISVATPGVDISHFYPRSQKEIDGARLKYRLPENYVMSLSNLEPRKNLDGLVDAYCLLPREVTDKYALVLVGVKGWKTNKLLSKIKRQVAQGYKILLPKEYLTDEDRPAVLSGASLLVFPSHYEGFGMPPLEALACGTPVIVPNNSSLPEAVGEVGILTPDNTAPVLSEAMKSTLKHINVQKKHALIKGPLHAKSFSWNNSAAEYVRVADRLTSRLRRRRLL